MSRKRYLAALSILILQGLTVGYFLTHEAVKAANADTDQVILELTADADQPAGHPLLINATLTNIGNTNISWWCGGPAGYPGSKNFLVEVRYDNENAEWQEVQATNGQYFQGSGIDVPLQPADSIVVPLAIPVTKEGVTSIRIRPRDWKLKEAATVEVTVHNDQPQLLDLRRTLLIKSVVAGDSRFLLHVCETYPDKVVLHAMYGLIAIDNPEIARCAAQVLAAQDKLPAACGEILAGLAKRWSSRPTDEDDYYLRMHVITAALKTETEVARTAMIELMRKEPSLWCGDALSRSNGDVAWLERVHQVLSETLSDDLQYKQPKLKSLRDRIERLRSESMK